MVRARKSIKVRPPKPVTHLKYTRTGTYTGLYKGLPISQQRLNYIETVVKEHEQKKKGRRGFFENRILGAPIAKTVPLWTNDSAATSNTIYCFFHHRTKQVLYSLTRHIDPSEAMVHLTFYGKKTLPAKIRKDDWRPMIVVGFPTHELAVNAYRQLYELRMLRDYAWRDQGKSALLKKKERRQWLMDHRGTTAADLATVIEKANGTINQQFSRAIAEWGAVEDMAVTAFSGGLHNMKKHISRAQRKMEGKFMGKKWKRMSVKTRRGLRREMLIWTREQTMMYKARAAVLAVQKAAREGRLAKIDDEKLAQQESKRLPEPRQSESESTDSVKLEKAAQRSETMRPVEKSAKTADEKGKKKKKQTPFRNTAYQSFFDVSTRDLRRLTSLMEKRAYNLARYGNVDIMEDKIYKEDRELEHKARGGVELAKLDLDIDIYWVDIEHRQRITGWPENVVHMAMGAQRGRDQYVALHRSQLHRQLKYNNTPVYRGDDDIDEGIRVVQDFDPNGAAIKTKGETLWEKPKEKLKEIDEKEDEKDEEDDLPIERDQESKRAEQELEQQVPLPPIQSNFSALVRQFEQRHQARQADALRAQQQIAELERAAQPEARA